MAWTAGACLKAEGQYDRQVVFEHWTCRDFKYCADAQDPHPDWFKRQAESHAWTAANLIVMPDQVTRRGRLLMGDAGKL